MAMTCDRVRELAPGFVLGALETEEMIVVQDHLDSCSEPHPEMDELGGVVPYIAQTLMPLEPPAWLRDSVIAAARADSQARRRVGKGSEHRIAEHVPTAVVAEVAVAAPTPFPAPEAFSSTPDNVIPMRRRIWSQRGRIASWTTRVAAALLVFSLAGYAYVVQNDLNRAKATDVHSIVTAIGPGSQTTALAATQVGEKAAGVAVLQPTGHMLVWVNHLAATAGDQAYIVWTTAQDGTLSKVGWFTVDASGQAVLEYDNLPRSPSLWVFICKEPNSGVMKPSGPIILSGTLTT